MKKKLNVDMIQSELRGGSAFFPGYKGSASSTPSSDSESPHDFIPDHEEKSAVVHDVLRQDTRSGKSPEQQHTQGVPPPVPRTVPRTEPPKTKLIPKTKRAIKQRQPFDIYEDQYARLKEIADTERGFVNGRGMSQMVREAIDDYLAEDFSPRE